MTRDISRRSCVVSIEVFLVIPQKPGDPPVAEAPSTDPYFTASFPNAVVIEVKTFEFAVENATTVGSATGGAGAKARFDQLVIRKFVDKSSTSLFSASVSGEHFAVVHLFVRQDGTGQPSGTAPEVPFLDYEFQTVFITNIDWSGSAGDPAPVEAVTFEYGALKIVYKAPNPDGTLGGPVSASWSQVSNSADVADTGSPQ
jgi:type VI secretion system secreted protein Hcp